MLANEVLEKTYLALKDDLPEVFIENPVYVVVTEHGGEKEHMIYNLYFVYDERWIVSIGKGCKRNSKNRYGSDIAIIPFNPEKSIEEMIQCNKYFFYSPIFTYSSGEFAVRKDSFFSEKMIGVVSKLGAFEVKKGVYDERIVEHLRDKIREILS